MYLQKSGKSAFHKSFKIINIFFLRTSLHANVDFIKRRLKPHWGALRRENCKMSSYLVCLTKQFHDSYCILVFVLKGYTNIFKTFLYLINKTLSMRSLNPSSYNQKIYRVMWENILSVCKVM